uniref:Ovule protein n=1 Tax=Heterorhabditis bacteriophora TaxID=37862 RepID=A0A1I7WP74_HETBA
MFYSAYFPRPIILRSPPDSHQVYLMAKCPCSKSLETAIATTEQLFWFCERVPSLVEMSNSLIGNVLRPREPLFSINCSCW